MPAGDNFSNWAGSALRTLGSRYPTTYLVASGFGMATKMLVHANSSPNATSFLSKLDSFSWFHFSIVWVAVLLIPAVLGKNRVPERVKENLQSLKLALEQSGMPETQHRSYFDLLIRAMIKQISSNYQVDTQGIKAEEPEKADTQVV